MNQSPPVTGDGKVARTGREIRVRHHRRGGACASPSAGLQLAWPDTADDVYEAYLAGRDSDLSERAGAFIVYLAAIDREEAAARAMELQATGRAQPLK